MDKKLKDMTISEISQMGWDEIKKLANTHGLVILVVIVGIYLVVRKK